MPELSTSLPLNAARVADLLREIGTRLEFDNESPFKVRAYYVAADNLLAQSVTLEQLVATGKLKSVPGVGEAIAEKILKLHRTGSHPTLDYLREKVPAGVLDLVRIPGVGPKKAITLYSELQISTLDTLDEACRAGKLAEVKGFGAKLQAKIIEGIALIRSSSGLCRMDQGHQRAHAARQALQDRFPSLKEVQVGGVVRRGCETCGQIVLAARYDGLPPDGLESSDEIRIFDAPTERFGAALLFATGSDAHLAALRTLAQLKGFSLSATGLVRGGDAIPCPTEEAIYTALDLPYIEPELREGRGEIEFAAHNKLPRLIQDSDLRGILHCHTAFTDGSNTLEEMAHAARKLGAQYFGVCDHSQSAAYAGGMKFEKVKIQHALADALNAAFEGKNFRIFKGIESDILKDGALDYPPEQLATFDFVVASVHSLFTLSKADQTARVIRAVENPFTTILGHPTGRLLLQRQPYEIDIDAVLKACAAKGVAVEINADPHRLDLDWRHHQRALELGCLLSINPDAHDTASLDLQKWGVKVARKGGVPADRVLNCLDLPAITRHFASRRNH